MQVCFSFCLSIMILCTKKAVRSLYADCSQALGKSRKVNGRKPEQQHWNSDSPQHRKCHHSSCSLHQRFNVCKMCILKTKSNLSQNMLKKMSYMTFMFQTQLISFITNQSKTLERGHSYVPEAQKGRKCDLMLCTQMC